MLSIGAWDLVWTTESELLFLSSKGFFGLPCTGVSQTISRPSRDAPLTLSNEVEFLDGYLSVGSTCEPDDDARVDFKFEACEASVRGLSHDQSCGAAMGYCAVCAALSAPCAAGKARTFHIAQARWRGLTLPLPPVGSGWFEVIYLDDEIRLARDVRGDLQARIRSDLHPAYDATLLSSVRCTRLADMH